LSLDGGVACVGPSAQFQNCLFDTCGRGVETYDASSSAQYPVFSFSDCVFRNVFGRNIFVIDNLRNTTINIDGCVFSVNPNAKGPSALGQIVEITSCGTAKITRNTFTNIANGTYAVYFAGTDYDDVNNVYISGNSFQNIDTALGLVRVNGGSVSHNIFQDTTNTTIWLAASDLSISDNLFVNCGRAGGGSSGVIAAFGSIVPSTNVAINNNAFRRDSGVTAPTAFIYSESGNQNFVISGNAFNNKGTAFQFISDAGTGTRGDDYHITGINTTVSQSVTNGTNFVAINSTGGAGDGWHTVSPGLNIQVSTNNGTNYSIATSNNVFFGAVQASSITTTGNQSGALSLTASNLIGGQAFSVPHNMPVWVTNQFAGSNFAAGQILTVLSSNNGLALLTWSNAPAGVGGENTGTNANQFGAAGATLTIKDGARLTNIVVGGLFSITNNSGNEIILATSGGTPLALYSVPNTSWSPGDDDSKNLGDISRRWMDLYLSRTYYGAGSALIDSIVVTNNIQFLGHNAASNYVWTATNANGMGEWRARMTISSNAALNATATNLNFVGFTLWTNSNGNVSIGAPAAGSGTNILVSTNSTTAGSSIGTLNFTTGIVANVSGSVANLTVGVGTPSISTPYLIVDPLTGQPTWMRTIVDSEFESYSGNSGPDAFFSTTSGGGGSTSMSVKPNNLPRYDRNGFVRLQTFATNAIGGTHYAGVRNETTVIWSFQTNTLFDTSIGFETYMASNVVQAGLLQSLIASNHTAGIWWEWNPISYGQSNWVFVCKNSSSQIYTSTFPVAINSDWVRLSWKGDTNSVVAYTNGLPCFTNSNVATIPGGTNLNLYFGAITTNGKTNDIGSGMTHTLFIDYIKAFRY
jgi:hypothetical protein